MVDQMAAFGADTRRNAARLTLPEFQPRSRRSNPGNVAKRGLEYPVSHH